MPSSIDDTKPASGQQANKADLRSNLTTAKTELDHGGFAEGLSPSNYSPVDSKVVSHLAAIDSVIAGLTPGSSATWVNVVTTYGADNTGATDTRAELQEAIDSGLPLYLPPGTYLINGPLKYHGTSHGLVMRGGMGNSNTNSLARTVIQGNFEQPLLHIFDQYLSWDNQLIGDDVSGSGRPFILEDLCFRADHNHGCCVQVQGSQAPCMVNRCRFVTSFRGIMMHEQFDGWIMNCRLSGGHTAGEEEEAIGIYVHDHVTVLGCSIQGMGTGIYLNGAETSAIGHRIEVCGIGVRMGGPSRATGTLGQNWLWERGRVEAISTETNTIGYWIDRIGAACTLESVGAKGGSNGPSPSGFSHVAYLIDGGSHNSVKLSNIQAAGTFLIGTIVINNRLRIEGTTIGNGASAGRPEIFGLGTLFSKPGGSDRLFGVERLTLNEDGINSSRPDTEQTITAWSDIQLPHLAGLNIRDQNILPRNFGGLETVATSATSHAVSFPPVGTSSQNTIGTLSAAGGGSLAAGQYRYATTVAGRRGESGVDLGSEGSNYKSITVSSNQQVTIPLSGTPDAAYKRRIYRSSVDAPLGQFEGYWDIDAGETSFVDTGSVAFTGRGGPPPSGYTAEAQTEADANYAVVATPSWPCFVRVTNKGTAGFTLEFYEDGSTPSAAPTGATVQWLLFRP